MVYQPRIARFVPDFEDLNSGEVSEINGGYDTSSGSIKMWVGGLGVRPASSEERQFPHVPSQQLSRCHENVSSRSFSQDCKTWLLRASMMSSKRAGGRLSLS